MSSHNAPTAAETLEAVVCVLVGLAHEVKVTVAPPFVCNACGALAPGDFPCDLCAARRRRRNAADRARRARHAVRPAELGDPAPGTVMSLLSPPGHEAAASAPPAAAASPMELVDASLDPGQLTGQTALPLPPGTYTVAPGEQLTLADALGRLPL